jgi:PhoH-like ATPase
MRNKYILDTSVLIHDSQAIKSFRGSDVLLPITIFDELDKLKKSPGLVGKNARVTIRFLDEISATAPDLSAGILLENDIFLTFDAKEYQGIGDSLYGDTRILACAQNALIEHKDGNVIIVSKDANMRFRARLLGLMAEDYNKESGGPSSDLYPGIQYIKDEVAGNDLISLGTIFPPTYDYHFRPNECIVFQDKDGNEIAQGRQANDGNMKLIKKTYPWGLSPRNTEQSLAIDLMMDVSIPLVTFVGKAGCGKSLIALAAALELVLEKREYDKFIIYRPIQPVGNDIGFLPGSEAEKLEPWFTAIMDNLEILFGAKSGEKWRANLDAARRKEKIRMEAITYIRGRSISNAIILLDEAQNLDKDEIKTILTRIGEGTKIILTGDLNQIDTHHLDIQDNGLAYIIERFKNSALAGHITFTQGERSELATLASHILE